MVSGQGESIECPLQAVTAGKAQQSSRQQEHLATSQPCVSEGREHGRKELWIIYPQGPGPSSIMTLSLIGSKPAKILLAAGDQFFFKHMNL